MKKLCMAAIITISSFACSQSSGVSSKEGTARFDLQRGFKHSSVKIYLNGILEYQNSDITTNLILDLACGTTLRVFPGKKNHIKVMVDGKIAFERNISSAKDVYFGISKNQNGHFSVEKSNRPFLYD